MKAGPYARILSERKNHDISELDVLCRKIPVRVMKDADAFVRYVVDNGFGMQDVSVMIAWIGAQQGFLDGVVTKGDITHGDCCKFLDTARTNAIVVNRTNFFLHQTMVWLFDYMRQNRIARGVANKAVSDVEREWHKIHLAHRTAVESKAWYAMQDYMIIAFDTILPKIEDVCKAIAGEMDELTAMFTTVLLMGRMAVHTYRQFFDDLERDSGVDYRRLFTKEDMQPLLKAFSEVCRRCNIPIEKDDKDCWFTKGYKPGKKVEEAWAALMDTVRNDDIMDESAKEAINLNPEIKKDYQKYLNEEQ